MSLATLDRKDLQVAGGSLKAYAPTGNDIAFDFSKIFEEVKKLRASEQAISGMRQDMQKAGTTEATVAARVNTTERDGGMSR